MNAATTILRKEHDAILRMLDVTEEVARQLDARRPVAPERLFELLEFFRLFESGGQLFLLGRRHQVFRHYKKDVVFLGNVIAEQGGVAARCGPPVAAGSGGAAAESLGCLGHSADEGASFLVFVEHDAHGAAGARQAFSL